MKILNLKASNFYSYKDLSIDFTQYNGIVRILGKNFDTGASNGSGKSAIIEAVIWGIFGSTLRKSTEEAMVNIDTGEGLCVEVEIEKEGVGSVYIKRSKRPTSLVLEVNGITKVGENARETQDIINELLETDYKSYVTSLAFGQHADKFFLDSSPEDKRKIIRNCFDLEDLFSKRNAVKQLKSAYSAELKVITNLTDKLKKEELELSDKVPDPKYKLMELPSLEEVLAQEKKVSDAEYEIRDIQRDLKKDRDRLRRLKDSHDKGIYQEDEECPVCRNTYSKEQTQNDVDKLHQDMNDIEGSIADKEESILTLKGVIMSETPHISSSEWAKYNHKNKLIENAQASIDRLRTVRGELEEYERKSQKLQSLIVVMKFWETAFSEKGLIRYIIRNILDYFNMKVNEYVSILTDSQFTIEFNDDLSEEISNNGKITKYISLSGGEKRKVNLAIMLALQDLSSKISKTNCNLMFFDEVCDNIDDSGIEAVNNLLVSLKGTYPDKVILMITHNNRLQDLLSETQSINVIKSKGTSRVTNGN